MFARTSSVAALAMAAALVLAPSASAARHGGGGSGPSGYDISYPQCGSAYPTAQKFGIVGVNGGLANDANSCLSGELTWATASPGLTSPSQPPASLYINTADPGPGTSSQPIADWPQSGSSSAYGTCSGGWTTACAYVYGEQRSAYSYGLVNAINASLATTAPWWLDIETGNSWATSSTSGYTALNIATIRGFVDGLHNSGAGGTVGIYSTGTQWGSITGLNSTSSQSYFASQPDWVAGAGSARQASSNCSATFTGGHVALAQYPSGGFDADLACP